MIQCSDLVLLGPTTHLHLRTMAHLRPGIRISRHPQRPGMLSQEDRRTRMQDQALVYPHPLPGSTWEPQILTNTIEDVAPVLMALRDLPSATEHYIPQAHV